MSMSKYIEAPEEFDGQGQGRMPAVGSGWVGSLVATFLTPTGQIIGCWLIPCSES